MLILTRRVGETVMIGDEVTVVVLGVKGNQVRMGITAPRTVAVHREEIFERIKREEHDGDDATTEPKVPTELSQMSLCPELCRCLYLRSPHQYHGALPPTGAGANV